MLFKEPYDLGSDIHQPLNHGHEIRLDAYPQLTDAFLKVAKVVFHLLDLAFRRCGQGLVHATHALADDLGERSHLLSFGTVLQDLLLGFVELVAVAAQCTDLAFHHLAHHGGNLSGLLLRSVEAVLLRQHVVHHGDQLLEAFGLFKIGAQFLSTSQLDLVADDSKLLLRCGQFLDRPYLLVRSPHGVAHHAGKLRL